ncbi:hypothetical protein THAOC_27641 [Thalassiosira oceanica]|uniref:Leucine-rich repeat domain-containing protein n=1 Tax=Thalassiosira oceanica TaxID=159749 RepID=K0RGZ1_THAOC|nr:hypothetical protein THAOC_27641 [Thalassiosira oceanica]|eukprot:EJK52998.1 hypothetical protein THAOC_27641 [Thalassiosira oceanica]
MALQQVAIPSSVTKLGYGAFSACTNLTEVKFGEGLEIIRDGAFQGCTALRSVTIPSSVTKLGNYAFDTCRNLAVVQFSDGVLQAIGDNAFRDCTTLRSATFSSVAKLGQRAFIGCRNLTEVILLGGERLLNQGFFDRGLSSEEGALDQKKIKELLRLISFPNCSLTTVKASISKALSDRMARMSLERRLSVEGRIRGLRSLELTQDGNILACFPVVSSPGVMDVQDTNNQTARSLHQVLRLISFYELKESSILVELAMWKSRLNKDQARADCRTPIPDPAKRLILEYCGFVGFLTPAIEGD